MNDEALNISIRKFLKMVGVSSQREIEQAVKMGISSGKLAGNEKITATMTLDIPELEMSIRFEGRIELE